MSEPTLIEQQRDLLRTLHSLIAQRKRAEADITARFKSWRETAEAELEEAQQQADAQLEEAQDTLAQARDLLKKWGRTSCN